MKYHPILREIIWIGILALVGVVVYVRLDGSGSREISSDGFEDHQARSRLVAYELAAPFYGARLPDLRIASLSGEDLGTFEALGLTVIIALSNSACSPCQNRELGLMNELFREQATDGARVVGMYDNPLVHKEAAAFEAGLIRKVNEVEFPIYVVLESGIANFVYHGRYPMIFLVENGIVIHAYSAIIDDAAFSDVHLGRILRLIGSRVTY